MTITNGNKSVKLSIWEISTIVGGVTSCVCTICNVINKNRKTIEKVSEVMKDDNK